MREHEPAGTGMIGLLPDLARAIEQTQDVVRHVLDVRRFGEQQVGVLGQIDEIIGWPSVTRVRHGTVPGAQPDPCVWQHVRQEPRFGVEWSDRQHVAGFEVANVACGIEHARSIEREYGPEGTRERVQRERRGRCVAHRARPQERIEIGDVVGMPVADQDRVDRLGRNQLEQAG